MFGVWRSWLARTAGGREVAGSSPVTPTRFSQCLIIPKKEFGNEVAKAMGADYRILSFKKCCLAILWQSGNCIINTAKKFS